MTCKHCGAVIEGKVTSRRQFCTDACRTTAKRQKDAKRDRYYRQCEATTWVSYQS